MLFYLQRVELLVEACGVAVVLGEGGGEAVSAVHLVGGTEIEVVGLFGVDDGVDAGFRGQADGGGWQAGVEVGVEGTLHRKVFVENALKGEVAHGILHRRVGLEGHALAISGFSVLLLVSSSTIEAKIIVSSRALPLSESSRRSHRSSP